VARSVHSEAVVMTHWWRRKYNRRTGDSLPQALCQIQQTHREMRDLVRAAEPNDWRPLGLSNEQIESAIRALRIWRHHENDVQTVAAVCAAVRVAAKTETQELMNAAN
jgi:hypothetical protein